MSFSQSYDHLQGDENKNTNTNMFVFLALQPFVVVFS